MSIVKIFTIALIAILSGSAFANGDYGASGIGRQEVRRIGNVVVGTVLEVRRVSVKIEAGYAEKAAGASIGAVLGGAIGNKAGNGNYAATALMGVVGGIAGSIAGDRIGTERKEGIEVVILIPKTGELVTVSQEATGTTIPAPGSEVYIASVNGVTRVFPVNSNIATSANARM